MGGLHERRRIGSTPLHLNPPLCSGRVVCAAGQQPYLAGLDLQREILRVDATLGEAPGDEPQARLGGAREHVAQLLFIAESPDGADASVSPRRIRAPSATNPARSENCTSPISPATIKSEQPTLK